MNKPKIMIDTVDVTEEVAAMYDAIVTSLDWGSNFLDADQIRSILTIGMLAGFDIPNPTLNTPGYEPATYEPPYDTYITRCKEAVEKWRVQFKAEIAAKRADEEGKT